MSPAADAAPTSVEEVTGTLQQTLLGAWEGFVEPLPYLVVSLLLLLATWPPSWRASPTERR